MLNSKLFVLFFACSFLHFQDQNARHSTICEFSLPDVEWTTEPGGSTQMMSQTPLTNTFEEVSKITIPVTSKTTVPNGIIFST